MKLASRLPAWSIASPLLSWALLAYALLWPGDAHGGLFDVLLAAGLVAGILAAVFHAEVVAHRVGEPFGTLVLALAVTAIEVALIVSLMLAGGESASTLARDTVFASVMIILNGMVGICLLSGGSAIGSSPSDCSGCRRRWRPWRRSLFSRWCCPISRPQRPVPSTAPAS